MFTVGANVWKSWHAERRKNGLGLDLDEEASEDPNQRALERLVSQGSDAEQLLLAAERRELVRVEIESMPPKMRRCLMLRIYQGRTYEEIGSLMRMPVNTVKSHLAQAKDRLKKRLGAAGGTIEQ